MIQVDGDYRMPIDGSRDDLIRSLIGKRLTGLARSQYVFNGEADEVDAGDLEFTFDNETKITLELASDGESVLARDGALSLPEPFDLDAESHCSWVSVDLLQASRFAVLRHSILQAAYAVIGRWPAPVRDEFQIGWLLRFDDGQELTYFNNGDDAVILLEDTIPASAEMEILIREMV
ncbi:hypothetical protein [Marinobacter sp. NFXS9]|uniref:hypothetical protein n=1 Tax=Marinobacter sp. NFXS9 TaxID=2818433 RepID=UPI0032DE33FD